MTTWTLEESGGEFVLSWGRRRKTFTSEDAALKFVREQRAKKDRVFKVDEDGYRTPVTKRRHWREPS